MAFDFGPGIRDFSPLGDLGKTFFDARKQATDAKVSSERRALLASLGQSGEPDYKRVGLGLLGAGDIQSGVALLGLAQKDGDRAREADWFRSVTGGGQQSQTPTGGRVSSIPTGNMGVQIAENESDVQRLEKEMAAYEPMAAREQQYGLPSGYLGRTAQIESGGNPNAQNPNSSAGGAFQFIDSTAKQYGLTNKFDPNASADAAARLAADNKRQLTAALGREPTAGELYLAHQQGGGGASKLLANPNARAVDVVGVDAVRLNGGSLNETSGQFASRWVGKFGNQPTQMARAAEPVQTEQNGGQAVASVQGDDPAKLRQDAAFYEQSNPEAARQFRARADAAEQGRGVQMADAGSSAPAPGASQAQGFAIPGQPAAAAPGLLQDQNVQRWSQAVATAPTDRARAYAKSQLDLAVAEAKTRMDSGGPLQQENQRLQNQKLRRDLNQEGARPMTPEERKAFGVPENQPAFMKRNGEPSFGPSSTVVKNEGTIPPGYRAVRDQNGNLERVEPVPGSKAEIEARELAEKRSKAQIMRGETGNSVSSALNDINILMKGATLPVAGPIGSRLSGISGTAAHDVKQALLTIGANISFDKLQQMRESSPTGGALGAVTERELELLQNSMAALSQTQSLDQFRSNLGRVRTAFERTIHGRVLTPQERKIGGPMTPERARSLRDEAQQAIASGASRGAVLRRLKEEFGISPEGL